MNMGDGETPGGMPAAAGCIAIHLGEARQLFDALDPSPYREKDLDPKVERYVVESVKDLASQQSCALVIYLDHVTGHPDEASIVGDAIRNHFARHARILHRDLRRLLRRGVISLGIGIVFLVVVFGAVRVVGRLVGDSDVVLLWREGLLILGWVATWRPLEIFLYDWWPILGEQRLRDRLSRIPVSIIHDPRQDQDDLARILNVARAVGPAAGRHLPSEPKHA